MFTSVYTVVEGALDRELDIPDGPDAQAALDAFVADTERASKEDGCETAVYVMPHYHEQGDDCECAQWLTSHLPAFTFNVD